MIRKISWLMRSSSLIARPERFIEKGPALLTLVAKRRMIDAARSPRNRLLALEADIVDPQLSAVLEHEAAELRELMLSRANGPGERNVVDLRCKGHTLTEIAELTGMSARTLQRFWKAFPKRMSHTEAMKFYLERTRTQPGASICSLFTSGRAAASALSSWD